MKRFLSVGARGALAAIALAAVSSLVFGQTDEVPQTQAEYCIEQFFETGKCPEHICQMTCTGEETDADCEEYCAPRACPDILAEFCPEKYCTVMDSCSGEKICHYQMHGEKAECGDVAYAGQDVPCCPGLERRCGIEFMDSTCDMEGKNSVYNIPICIPCGNGICEQFENRCNCPEDCGLPLGLLEKKSKK